MKIRPEWKLMAAAYVCLGSMALMGCVAKSLYAIGWYFVLAGIWSLYLVSECRDALLASGVRS